MKKLFRHIILLFFVSQLLVSCNKLFQGDTSDGSDGREEEPAGEILEDIPEEIPELETAPEAIQEQVEIKGGTETTDFYKTREYAPAWSKAGNRTAFLEELQKAGSEGLFLEDYYSDDLQELLQNQADLTSTEIALLDVLLTEAFFSYGQDLYYGKLDPKKLYKNWGVARKNPDLKRLLQNSLEEDRIAEAISSLKPAHQIYHDLKNSLEEYDELRQQEKNATQIKSGDLIKPGDGDERLPAIAKRLEELGILEGPVSDSLYSEKLQDGIETFQKDKGLQVDGIIGNSTIAELNMTSEERYRQILVNLERWRWYPRDLGEHYILINIPQFKLAVVKEGDTVRNHNIIAGTRARQTPIFSDTIKYVVINPTWTIPPTIKTKDVIPKAAKNSSYLASHNMKVYGKDRQLLDPGSIDWSRPEVRSYTFVQRAGPSNPLGRVKIIYPNRYLVYLHDTPAQNLFSQNQRAESSGCVRVENAVDLSGYVLRDQEEWNEEKIRETIASGKTIEVKINQPIQVHHFYWTAWRAGGKTVFTEDVYRLDKEVYNRLTE